MAICGGLGCAALVQLPLRRPPSAPSPHLKCNTRSSSLNGAASQMCRKACKSQRRVIVLSSHYALSCAEPSSEPILKQCQRRGIGRRHSLFCIPDAWLAAALTAVHGSLVCTNQESRSHSPTCSRSTLRIVGTTYTACTTPTQPEGVGSISELQDGSHRPALDV